MTTPYIGVTDFTTKAQVKEAISHLLPWTDRRLHVGVMISYKTLNKIPTATGWENIWLNEKQMHAVFEKESGEHHPDQFNVIHYADYPDETGKVATKIDDLIRAVKYAGPNVDGIQLDMIWPNGKFIGQLKEEFPKLEVILQVSSKAEEWAQKYKMTAADVLQGYDESYIDYILLDAGMGRGIEFDPGVVLGQILSVMFQFPEEKIAVAGGLGPDTYKNLKPILQRYPKISCDAQGQLRPSGKATDPLDMKRVTAYIDGICSLL